MNKKSELLKASKKLFSKKGFDATSIRDISSEANVNSSMISYYFSNKDGLLVGIFEEYFPVIKFERISDNPELNIKVLLRSILRLRKNDTQLIDILHREILLNTNRLSQIQKYIEPFWFELKNQLKLGKDLGVFNISSIDVSYMFILASISFPYHNKIFTDSKNRINIDDHFIDDLIEIIIKGLR